MNDTAGSIKAEVNRLADIAHDRYLAANQSIAEAVRGGDAHTPFTFEQAAASQYLDALWLRTKTYVTTGSEASYVIGNDRLPDTTDSAAALQGLVAALQPPTPYRGEDFPMDRAFQDIEQRSYEDWKAACQTILTNTHQAA
ncbi:hypothetical protein ACFXOD_36585 [Streptomyces sp. NPDC059161]|uniref:hypothetical protein n=1 Tax=Streptomyces sp. NPDC059161 TaxID=3346749 RepID=UPI003677A6B1